MRFIANIGLLAALALVPIAADAATTLYERGPILGTTTKFVNIEVGTGIDRTDQRFEMAENPPIFVLSRSHDTTPRRGDVVHAVLRAPSPPSIAEVMYRYPPGSEARYPWDARHAGITATTGRVTSVTIEGANAVAIVRANDRPVRVRIPRGTPIFDVRPGGRPDVPAGRAALIIATQMQYAIYGVAQAIVVSADASVPPI